MVIIDGAKIRRMREERKVTLEKLAKEVGITHNMMLYIETDKRKPSIDVLKYIADYFGVKVDDLIISTA